MIRTSSQNLKALLLASAVAVGFGFAAIPSQAAGVASDTVELSSAVAVNCTIAISNKDGVLDIVAGETSKKVADIIEDCNESAGYKITISSANAGNLEGTGALAGNTGASVDYTVSYDTVAAADLATDATAFRTDAVFNQAHGLFVSVAGSDTRLAGSYEDTVTLTIAAN